MLHGDCVRRTKGEIGVYRTSFDNHCAARAIFGYLDHPFSRRYQYGWESESERLTAHQELLDHIEARPSVWRASLTQCLGFLRKRDAVQLWKEPDGRLGVHCPVNEEFPPVAVCWKGEAFAA